MKNGYFRTYIAMPILLMLAIVLSFTLPSPLNWIQGIVCALSLVGRFVMLWMELKGR